MTGLREIFNLLADWAAQGGVEMSRPGWWPNPPTLIAALLVLGVILAFWGSRLLRLIYVLAFIVLGGILGVMVARKTNTDLLIGLVIGAGLIGLIGHLLFRWWVGVTAACCAALLVLTVAANQNAENLISALMEYHQQQKVLVVPPPPPGTSAGPESRPSPALMMGQVMWTLKAYLLDAFSYFRQTRQNVVAKVVIVAILAWITGLGMGLALPRFTTILGTACIGVAMISLGLGMLLATYAPETLNSVMSKDKYVAAGLGIVLLVSMIVQARHRRSAAQPSACPVPPPKAA